MALEFLRAFLTAHKRQARKATPDALWFIGLALVAYGIGMIFLPAGVIAAGLGLCFVGYVVAPDAPQTGDRE